MVRLKQRYILFDILYPPKTEPRNSSEREVFESFHKSPEDALLRMHRSSPQSIDGKSIIQATRKAIQDHYGEFGAGAVGQGLMMKYFSNKTSTGIIRCGRQSCPMVVASLALINCIGKEDIIIRCVHISGTIKKCEEFLIARNKELMIKLGHLQDDKNEFNNILNAFQNTGDDFANVKDNSEDEDED